MSIETLSPSLPPSSPGYTLKELQLYKDLKSQLDSQLAQQGHEMSSLHEHYTACLKQLQQVERLGFQATVLPINNQF